MIWSIVSKDEMENYGTSNVFKFYREALGRENIKLTVVDETDSLDFVSEDDIVLLRTASKLLIDTIRKKGVKTTAEDFDVYSLADDKLQISRFLLSKGILASQHRSLDNIKDGINIIADISPISNITINIIGNAGAAAATAVLAPLAAVVPPAAVAAPAVPAPPAAPALPAPPAAPAPPAPPAAPVPPAPPLSPLPFGSPPVLFPTAWFGEFPGVEGFPDSLPLFVSFDLLFFVFSFGSD